MLILLPGLVKVHRAIMSALDDGEHSLCGYQYKRLSSQSLMSLFWWRETPLAVLGNSEMWEGKYTLFLPSVNSQFTRKVSDPYGLMAYRPLNFCPRLKTSPQSFGRSATQHDMLVYNWTNRCSNIFQSHSFLHPLPLEKLPSDVKYRRYPERLLIWRLLCKFSAVSWMLS